MLHEMQTDTLPGNGRRRSTKAKCSCGRWDTTFYDGGEWDEYIAAKFAEHQASPPTPKQSWERHGTLIFIPPLPDVPAVFHSATIAHIYDPDFPTATRFDCQVAQGLCGVSATDSSNTRKVWHLAPEVPTDHPSCDPHHVVRWCLKCVGLAAHRFGIFKQVITQVVEAINTAEAS